MTQPYGSHPIQQQQPQQPPKKPFYKKWWFIALAALFIIAIASSAGSGGSGGDQLASGGSGSGGSSSKAPNASKAPAAEPATEVSAKKLIDVLEANALKAKQTYEDKRVTVKGVVGNIDASGDYFALDPSKDSFVITGIQVQTGDEFADQVANFNKGQSVTVTGTITGVGEITGYALEAESIK